MSGGDLLLVDDDPEITWSLGRYLTRAEFVVTACACAEEALRLLQSRRFQVVVTDIQLGAISGLELILWLRDYRPSVRIVAITAFGSPALRALIESSRGDRGVVHYLEKPVDPEQLVALLGAPDKEERPI